jgi:hypothetical protein
VGLARPAALLGHVTVALLRDAVVGGGAVAALRAHVAL